MVEKKVKYNNLMVISNTIFKLQYWNLSLAQCSKDDFDNVMTGYIVYDRRLLTFYCQTGNRCVPSVTHHVISHSAQLGWDSEGPQLPYSSHVQIIIFNPLADSYRKKGRSTTELVYSLTVKSINSDMYRKVTFQRNSSFSFHLSVSNDYKPALRTPLASQYRKPCNFTFSLQAKHVD